MLVSGKPRPRAHGVVYRDAQGVKHKAYLNKGSKNEILVSAGAVGSPQLLMLSGIGPKAHLESLGIKVLLDKPLVGQGMSDNPMNAIYIPSPLPVETSLIQVVGITRFGSYIEAASGSLFTANPNNEEPRSLNFGMFSPDQVRTRETIHHVSIRPSAGPDELIIILQNGQLFAMAAQSSAGTHFSSRGGFLLEKVKGPVSTGHLELKNRNPDDNPSVTFNYFKEPEDLRRCVGGIETIKRVIQSKAFSKFQYPFISMEALLNMTASFPMNMLPKHDNDSKSLEQFCRDTVMTIWHYHGGCQVGRVVDRDYRVIGVDALRVIDGSTFIYSPGTNPQATVMMLGR